MGKVLTNTSIVKCAHNGKVKPTNTQLVLKVNGDDVLVGSLEGNIPSVPDPNSCTQQPIPAPPPINIPCTVIVTQNSGGISKVLKVNGSAVLLDTATGTTEGKPINTWSVKSSEQQVLQAD
jgi:hypothetical protein